MPCDVGENAAGIHGVKIKQIGGFCIRIQIRDARLASSGY
jgi:hypothetical protein